MTAIFVSYIQVIADSFCACFTIISFIPIISGTLPRPSNAQLRRDLYDQIYKHPAHRAEEEQQRDDRQVLAAVLIRAQQHQQADTGV